MKAKQARKEEQEERRTEKEGKSFNHSSHLQNESDENYSESESDGPDLSWLPDPDKIYGPKHLDGSEQEEKTSRRKKRQREVVNTDSESDDEKIEPKKFKKSNKFKKLVEEQDTDVMQEMALQLLSRK